MAISLMIYENLKNEQFHEWFRTYISVVSLFTVLGATNIEILHILSSNIAGLSIFSAKYSENAETLIIWLSTLNIFLEDIPQFVIQVNFKF